MISYRDICKDIQWYDMIWYVKIYNYMGYNKYVKIYLYQV